jgi:putative ABC transport system ATP-binding protein
MLKVKKVTKIYNQGKATVMALNNVSFQADKGDFIAITGPSGSGKSTLLNVVGGLDSLSSGEVLLDGERIDNLDENGLVNIRRRKISYVFQQYYLLPSLSAIENVLLPLMFSGVKNQRKKALDLLKTVGLGKRAGHKPSQLSGGEQQRVAIARALVNDPLLTLADEPTGNVDQKTNNEILDLFCQLNKEGHTIIMVTHNPRAAERAKEIIILEDGQIRDGVRQKGNTKKNK